MLKSRKIHSLVAGIIAIMAFVVAVPTVFGADLRVDTDHSSGRNGTYLVPVNDTVRNLYSFGPNLVVDASASKDAVVAGGTVTVNGNTADDLIAAGGTVNLNGDVGGSLRVAGGNININSKVGDDLVIAGGNVYVSPRASIAHDLLIAGGNVTVDAPVHGNIKITSGSLNLNSTVDGNIDGTVQRSFVLGPGANIKGNINYTSRNELKRDPAAVVSGTINYTHRENRTGAAFVGAWILGHLVQVIAEIFAAFVLLLLFRRRFEAHVADISHRFWRNALVGLIGFILVPIAGIILMITVIGIYISIALFVWYVLMLMIAWLVAASAFGTWLLAKTRKTEHMTYWTVALGIVAATIIKAIPILGWLFALILVLAGFGSFMHSVRSESKE